MSALHPHIRAAIALGTAFYERSLAVRERDPDTFRVLDQMSAAYHRAADIMSAEQLAEYRAQPLPPDET